MTDEQILAAYYKQWTDNDHSEVKKKAVVSDVRRCWRMKKRTSQLACFDEWGDPAEALAYWLRQYRKDKKK
jgi:hypothetical protein